MAVAKRIADPPDDGGRNGGGWGHWFIEPMPEGLIESPLDFIFAEHHRQREAAAILSMIADGEFNRAGVERLIHFLTSDFALHVGDEETVLFPALKVYCRPDDDVERVIARLAQEHRQDEAGCDRAIKILQKRLCGQLLVPDDAAQLKSFAEHIRQHLALENGVLLPIARVRFSREALASISQSMKRRRGRS